MNMQDKSMNRAKDLSHEAHEKMSAQYNSTKQKAEDFSDQVKETASNLYEEGKEKISTLEDTVSDYTEEFLHTIKEKPIKSILIASGIGFLLAKLFKH